ncbi:xanthine dehydrogenase family protein molybdopterin-binding subunit [Stakelama tenebrarum]|uniref:Xanthine dehydrogenase family protein n=1 Tax=Stakelama tenebrarum TaxID=2711215 RepID=A0A6G6Y430_9SPHN|nr:xanthine dehydrogenase family protein molybdopterin-binding subunit [Sphingosinithalassobacter tenebrarum]QIG79649.1 xanthine dehydrogenase family protein [Sphingosinithalassobacter tenebrarum]
MSETKVAAARFVGQRMPRTEDKRLLTGKGVFVDDVSYPGMLHIAFVRSNVARGTIKSIDTDAARSMPGVRAIYTYDDIAKFDIEMVSFYLVSPPPGPKVTALANGRVAFVGDPVAMVVADSRALAEDAAAAVFVDIDEEPPVVTIEDAKSGAPVHPDVETNVAAEAGVEEDEDLEEMLSGAAHLITGTVRHQRIAQAPMETRGVVFAQNGSDITIHIACQSPHMVARYVAMAFRLPETGIRVLAKDVGGAFGLKVQPWREEIAAMAAGMLIGRPVKWIEDRLENLTAACPAREQICTLRTGFDENGVMVASHVDYAVNNGAYPHSPDANLAVPMFLWAPYKMPRLGFIARGWHSNTGGLAAYRGPWAMESLVRETTLDIAARRMKIDPIELRRRNIVTRADQPTFSSMGIPLEDVTPAECLELLLEKIDVPAFRKEQAEARKAGRYLGFGCATYIEPTGSTAVPVMASEMAQLRIEPTGKVSAMMSTFSQGHGTQTTMAQVIADHLGVPFEDVTVFEGDSTRAGFGPGAAGSRQAVAGGGAAIKTADILIEKIKRLAAHLLNATPDDVRIEDGKVIVSGTKEMTRNLADIAEIAYNEPDRLPEGMEPGLEAQYRYKGPAMVFASAAHGCIVEIDAESGFVEIKRWVVAEDCGVVINPAVVEGQVAGGVAQGIGQVLLENLAYDAYGNPTAATFKDYMLPGITDVPVLEFHHITTPSQAEGGFRGAGEGGNIIGPPTLVNAINDALAPFGADLLDLPLTPSKILAAMEGAG